MKPYYASAVAALLLSVTAGHAASGPPPDPRPDPAELARLDRFAQDLTQADKFSGVVLVAKSGRVLFEKAYGGVDEKRPIPATINTRYNLASAGKMFTSVAVWQQIAAHRLTLDTKVGQVMKDYPNKEFATKVTVRQLLTHTSGAGDIDLFGAENAANRARIHSVADMAALNGDRAPAFEPGSKQEYGNFAYVVLGRMVEVLSGEAFESYVVHHIFAPTGMTRTGFVDCTDSAPDLAVGYVTIDGKRQSNCLTQPARGLPAGGEVSTARDMYRFVLALQTGKLIPPAFFAEAITPYRGFMGLGFFATDYGPNVPKRDFRWGHGGSSDGACTDVRTYPATGETIVVLTNRDPPACFPVANFLHQQASK
jgi:CubicO group peptidase (beta-lactamase class C family)